MSFQEVADRASQGNDERGCRTSTPTCNPLTTPRSLKLGTPGRRLYTLAIAPKCAVGFGDLNYLADEKPQTLC